LPNGHMEFIAPFESWLILKAAESCFVARLEIENIFSFSAASSSRVSPSDLCFSVSYLVASASLRSFSCLATRGFFSMVSTTCSLFFSAVCALLSGDLSRIDSPISAVPCGDAIFTAYGFLSAFGTICVFRTFFAVFCGGAAVATFLLAESSIL